MGELSLSNINLVDIAINLARELKDNELLKDFCQNEFGKLPQFYVGEFLKRQIPTIEETPYIALCGMNKVEGDNVKYCEYTVTFVIGVGRETKANIVEIEDDIVMSDAYDVCNEFTQLIIKILHNRKNGQRPIAKLDVQGTYPVETDGTHWRTIMECTWHVYQTLGIKEENF